mgnify:CR=1 FL=1
MIRPFVLNHNCFLRPAGSPPSDLDALLREIGGNSGNSYITHALSRFTNLSQLDGVASIFSDGAIAAIDVEDVNANFTHVFLVLQDHLRVSAGGLPWQQLSRLITRFRLPIVVFSLGANSFGQSARQLAQSLPPAMTHFFRLLADRAQSMGIRGAFTAEVLDHLCISNYALVGCPAWFETGPDRIVAYPPFDALKPVAATGLFSHAESHKIQFLLQDEQLFLRSMFAGAPPLAVDAGGLVGGYPHYGACAVEAFYTGRMHFFHDMSAWKAALAQRYSFAAGTRVHGTFAAMNAGIPALCTAGDARAAEMCALFKVPHRPGLCAADMPLERLYELADPSAANAAYPALYQVFADWFESLGIAGHGRTTEATAWPIGELKERPELERAELLVSAIASTRTNIATEPLAAKAAAEAVADSGEPGRPLLSICIPTYNRAGHLEKLLQFLIANLLDDPTLAIELIVVNNASTDATRTVLKGFADNGVRIFHRERHLPTAEENIFHCVDYCRGEFVWFLGDDDIPMLANFSDHYALLVAGAHDFLLCNPAIVDSRGTISVLQNVKMNRHSIALPICDLVVTIGCFFTLAGISNGIIRRRLLSTERGLHYMGISQIYSMVAWMIDATKNARCVFVNAPLVYYRENDYSDGHWPRVAERLGVGDHHFWCGGVVALLEELIAQGCFTPADAGRIAEVDRNGRRYALIDDIVFKYYLQMKAAASDPDPRQRISDDQMTKAGSFFAKADPTTYDLVVCLRRMLLSAEPFKALEQDFLQRFGERQASGAWSRNIRQIYKGYEILETPIQFTAIRQGHGLRDLVMETIDPLPQPPFVLVAPTWREIAPLIDEMVASVPVTLPPAAPPAPPAPPSATGSAAELAQLAAAADEARQQLAAVYNSTSWQLTYPLRGLRLLVGRIVRTLLGR